MAAYSQPYYRALLVPDWRISSRQRRDGGDTFDTIWDANSSYTEAGPHPGTPGPYVPDAAQGMTLEASGEYASTAATFTVHASKGGHGTRTGSGAHVLISPDAGTTFYGWDRPGTVFGQELLDVSSTDQCRSPHLVTIPSSGTVLVAYHELQEASSGTVAVYTRKRAASTGTWSAEVSVYSGSSDYTQAVAATISNRAGPCMVVLPSERVLLFVLHEDITADRATIRMYFSDDEGASWKLGSTTCLPAAVVTSTYTVRRLRAAYLDGQIVLFLWRFTPGAGPSDEVLQYASSDLGASFVAVGTTANLGLPDVVARDGRFVVVYVPRNAESKASDPCWSILGSAWSPLSTEYASTGGTRISTTDAAAYDGSSNIDQASKLCLCVDEQGLLYAYWGATDAYGAMQDGTLASTSGTWEPMGTSSGQPVFDFAANDYLRELTAVCQRGRVIVAGSNTASTATTDHYLAAWYLGGYSTVELPGSDLAIPWYIASTGSYANIPLTWMPFELPADTGWTAGGTASAETLSTSGVSWYLHVTTAANVRHYTISPTASTSGMMALFVARSNNATSNAVHVIIRASGGGGGADEYTLAVQFDQTNIRALDNTTQRATAAHGLSSGWIEVLMSVDSSTKGSVWYRSYSVNEQRPWISLASGVTITAVSAGTTNIIRWGTNDTTNANYDVDFQFVGYVSGAAVGRGLAAGQTNPDDLHGRPIGALPMYANNGISIRATSGPAIRYSGNLGDAWSVVPRYDYQIDNIDPRVAPSPRDAWRSTQAAADETIAWQVDSVDDARMPTDLLGIHLEKVNFAQALIKVHDGSSLVTAITMTMAKQVTYTRQGQSFLISYVSSGYTGVIRQDELVGGALQLGTTSAAVIRRISANTGGTVQSSGNPRIPRVYCDLAEAGDSASGTGYLWFPRGTAVVPLSVNSTHVQGIQILVDDNATFTDPPEGYFTIGAAVVGSVYLFGFNPDLDRQRTRSALVDITESEDGRKRSRVRAPSRRTLTVNWNGVPTAELYNLGDRHVVSDGGGTPVVALRHEVPLLLDGLYDAMDGGHTPGVLLPAVAATGSQVILQGPVYGRFGGDLSLTTVAGQGRNEDDDEVIGVSFDWVEEV